MSLALRDGEEVVVLEDVEVFSIAEAQSLCRNFENWVILTIDVNEGDPFVVAGRVRVKEYDHLRSAEFL